MSNTKTIARNAGWYGLENVVSSVITLLTSIVIARVLGPAKMGYMIYVMWIASVVSSLGGLGIPSTTSKYMAEFIGMGDRGTARYIYFRTFLLQVGLATVATVGIIIWTLMDAGPEYRLAAVLVVLSIWPAMVNAISASANMATEQLSTNVPASIISTVAYFVAIGGTVVFKWGVIGVGGSFLIMRLVDFLVRLFPTIKRVLSWETTHVHPAGLGKRMMSFAWQSVASMILALIVWNRSELFLLKALCSDIRQVAYYSVAFSLADRLLLGAAIFGSAIGTTIYAQYGRDKSKLPAIAATSLRYLALTTIPLHFIFTALAAPALLFLYGDRYKGAVMVVTLAPLLCMPKAFISPVQSLLQSAEKQNWVIWATVFAGIVDIAVAAYLIPTHGAVGACIGSGTAQIMAVGTMWAIGIRLFKVKLPWLMISKVVGISIAASLTAFMFSWWLSPLATLLAGGSASLLVLLFLSYGMRVLEPEDFDRLSIVIRVLPQPMNRFADAMLQMLNRDKVQQVTTAAD